MYESPIPSNAYAPHTPPESMQTGVHWQCIKVQYLTQQLQCSTQMCARKGYHAMQSKSLIQRSPSPKLMRSPPFPVLRRRRLQIIHIQHIRTLLHQHVPDVIPQRNRPVRCIPIASF